MRRLIAPCACVLALVTGAWFGQAYVLFAPLDPVATPGEQDDRSIAAELAVRAFYDAVSAFVATGDAASIQTTVAADFVDQARPLSIAPGRDGFMLHLETVRHTFPGLRIEPMTIVGRGDTVTARVKVSEGAPVPFLGMSVAGAKPWAEVEVFTIAAGQVVARWGNPGRHVLFEPVAAERFTGLHSVDAAPTLTRRTYVPGASDSDVPLWGPALILVEAGSVVVDAGDAVVATVRRAATLAGGDAASGRPAETFDPVTLAPGDVLMVAEPAKMVTRNEARTPATVLVLTLVTPPPALPANDAGPAMSLGIPTVTLAGDVGPVVNGGALAVSIGRAILDTETGLAPHAVAGQEFALVESGNLTARIDGGRSWTHDWRGAATIAERAPDLGAGTSLTVLAGTEVSYRNDSATPLALLIVTITAPAPEQSARPIVVR